MIRSTGFFRAKSRNLLAMARQVVENHGGEIPRDLDSLTALAGVGRKTANVVLGTAFGLASGVVVDTHVKRLSRRLGLSIRNSAEQIEQELMQVVPRAAVGRFESSADPSRPSRLRGAPASMRGVYPGVDLSQGRRRGGPEGQERHAAAAGPPPGKADPARPPGETSGILGGNHVWPGRQTGRGASSTVMHIQDIFKTCRTTFSFEFFPPKTDQASTELFATIAHLQALRPSFVSVTYGAGGSTRERTHDLVVRIQRETMLTAVSHLTCVCHNLDEIAAILDRYADSAIENILALGGDPPRNMPDYDRSAMPSSTPSSS